MEAPMRMFYMPRVSHGFIFLKILIISTPVWVERRNRSTTILQIINEFWLFFIITYFMLKSDNIII